MPISFAAMSPFSFDSHPQRRISARASRRAEATNCHVSAAARLDSRQFTYPEASGAADLQAVKPTRALSALISPDEWLPSSSTVTS
jgi:hypothetical protein